MGVNQLSINQAQQLCSVLGLLHVMWKREVARNPLSKPVILSHTSSHSSGSRCTTSLQKLIFLLFSFINFHTDTCRHTERQKVVINIL